MGKSVENESVGVSPSFYGFAAHKKKPRRRQVTPRPVLRALTGRRGSTPCLRATDRQAAVSAPTAAPWFPRRSAETCFRLGSMRV